MNEQVRVSHKLIWPDGVTPDGAARLVCFHHAGGSATSFNTWLGLKPDWLELDRVQLPGR